MKSGLLTIGLALAVLPVFGQEQPKHYNKSVFSGFHRMQPVARNANLTRQKVQQVFPGMYITLDKMHGGFTDIFGTALAVSGGTPESKAWHLFANQLASLGVV